jgi:hypothetical protein
MNSFLLYIEKFRKRYLNSIDDNMLKYRCTDKNFNRKRQKCISCKTLNYSVNILHKFIETGEINQILYPKKPTILIDFLNIHGKNLHKRLLTLHFNNNTINLKPISNIQYSKELYITEYINYLTKLDCIFIFITKGRLSKSNILEPDYFVKNIIDNIYLIKTSDFIHLDGYIKNDSDDIILNILYQWYLSNNIETGYISNDKYRWRDLRLGC